MICCLYIILVISVNASRAVEKSEAHVIPSNVAFGTARKRPIASVAAAPTL